jgi:GH15 family glucan-1,4-alpha-glucosidase
LADDIGEEFHEIPSDSSGTHVYLIYAESPETTVNNSDAVVVDVSDSSSDTSQANVQVGSTQSQTSDVVGHLSGSSESESSATVSTPVHVNVPVMIEVLSDNNQIVKDVINAKNGRRSAMTRVISGAAQIVCTALGISLGLKLGAPHKNEHSNGTRE